MKEIIIKTANYITDYKVQIIFNDNKKRIIDFGKFLFSTDHPSFDKYRKINNFRKFKIEYGNIVWGKNWDLIFPINELYNGKIKH